MAGMHDGYWELTVRPKSGERYRSVYDNCAMIHHAPRIRILLSCDACTDVDRV